MTRNTPPQAFPAEAELPFDQQVCAAERPVRKGIRMRRHERRKTDSRIVVRRASSGTDVRLEGHCIDISEGGAGCVMTGKLPAGEFVVLEVALAGRQPFSVGARVCHAARFFHGFEFIAPSRSVTETIIAECDAASGRLRYRRN